MFTCLILLLLSNSLGSATLVSSIIKSFKSSGPLHCILELHESDLELPLQEDFTFPRISLSLVSHQKELHKESSEACKYHIIIVKNLDSLTKYGSLNHLKTTGQFAVIFQQKLAIASVQKALLDESGMFAKILNLALFVPQSQGKYSVHARDVESEMRVVLLDQWIDGDFRFGNDIFPKDRLENFHGVNLKATSFIYEPFIYKENGKYYGYEINILNGIAGALNFTYTIESPSDGGLWGEIKSNGTATGLVGDIKNGLADIGFADLFIIPERKKFIDYLYPHENDYVCFLVTKPPLKPKWRDLLNPFHSETWLFLILTFLVCTIFLTLASAAFPCSGIRAVDASFYLIALLFDESMSFTNRVKRIGYRLFLGIFLFMFYTLTMSYRGSLNAVLTVTFFPRPMNTLGELAKKDIQVGSFSATFQNSVGESLDPNLREISKKYVTHYDFEQAFRNASQDSLAMAESKQFLEFNLRKRFTNEFGETSMHIMNECFNSFRVAFTVPINSIYKKAFDKKMIQIIEAGLTRKYFADEMDKEARKAKSALQRTIWNSLTIHHLQAPLLILPIVHAFSVLIFCVEFSIGNPITN